MYIYQFAFSHEEIELDKQSAVDRFVLLETTSDNKEIVELNNQPLFEGLKEPTFVGKREDGTNVIRYEVQEIPF